MIGQLPPVMSDPDAGWTQEQAWAYALGAPYHVQHGMPVDALPLSTVVLRQELGEMLARDWSVTNADELAQTLAWLGEEGHRMRYRLCVRQYCLLPRPALDARRQELQRAGPDDPDATKELWRLDAVQADWHGVRGGTLLGFDAARAVMLVRCGLLMGWMAPAPAWRYLTDLAADVQRSFASWAEYAADYKLSRALWQASADPDLFDDVADKLLTSRHSPWRRLPWAQPGLGVPRPDAAAAQAGADDAGPAWVLG